MKIFNINFLSNIFLAEFYRLWVRMEILNRAAAGQDPKLNLFFVREKRENQTIGRGIACAVQIEGTKFILTSSDVIKLPTNSPPNSERSIYAKQCYKTRRWQFWKKRRTVEVDERRLRKHSFFSLIPIKFDPDEHLKVTTFPRPHKCQSLVVTKSGSYDTVEWMLENNVYQNQNQDEIVLDEASAAGSPVLWTNTNQNQSYVVGVITNQGGTFVPEIFTQKTLQQLTSECIVNY